MERLTQSARLAIAAAEDRLERAAAADDVEATIGGAKEFMETVAKAVLDATGAAYGSDASMDTLAVQVLRALDRHPAAMQGRPALQRLSSSVIGIAKAISEIRNTDGTGHGRATRSDLDASHARFMRASAEAWCEWVLATADRTLEGRASLDGAIADIGGSAVFRKGDLAAYLERLALVDLHESDQRKIGLAVARRWTVNQTFMPLVDVVEPIAEGEADYPAAFCEGLVEGFLLDHNGFIRTTSEDVKQALDVASRLSAARRKKLFRELADRIKEAQPSSRFDRNTQAEAAQTIRTLKADRRNASIGSSLDLIADRLAAIGDEAT